MKSNLNLQLDIRRLGYVTQAKLQTNRGKTLNNFYKQGFRGQPTYNNNDLESLNMFLGKSNSKASPKNHQYQPQQHITIEDLIRDYKSIASQTLSNSKEPAMKIRECETSENANPESPKLKIVSPEKS